jgi:hypothetical protein
VDYFSTPILRSRPGNLFVRVDVVKQKTLCPALLPLNSSMSVERENNDGFNVFPILDLTNQRVMTKCRFSVFVELVGDILGPFLHQEHFQDLCSTVCCSLYSGVYVESSDCGTGLTKQPSNPAMLGSM